MFNDQKDKTLIAQGNQKKFRQLIEFSSDELLHFAMGFLRNKETAEEIVSDVYVKIWNKRKELTKVNNLKSYLFFAVKNACLSHLRKTKNEKIVFLDDYDEFRFFPLQSIDENDVEEESLQQIYEAIDQLPAKCKLAFTLAKINGLKHKEIAEIMGVSEKTVNNHLVSAVKKITDSLGIEKKTRKTAHPLKRASLLSFLW